MSLHPITLRAHDTEMAAPFGDVSTLATVPGMATCPGALIVHADNTIMACTEDEEPDGCRARDLRHEDDPVRCWTWTLSRCNYCGVQ